MIPRGPVFTPWASERALIALERLAERFDSEEDSVSTDYDITPPTPLKFKLIDIAMELQVPYSDVMTVTAVELTNPEDYDDETQTVSAEGRDIIIKHFCGGADPRNSHKRR